MSPISKDELQKIRRKIQKQNAVREGAGRAKITVHMGTCGIASGARDVLSSLLADIARFKANDVIVSVSDCIGLCAQEPLVTVHKPGQEPVKYENMNPEKMRHIFEKHIMEGETHEPSVHE